MDLSLRSPPAKRRRGRFKFYGLTYALWSDLASHGRVDTSRDTRNAVMVLPRHSQRTHEQRIVDRRVREDEMSEHFYKRFVAQPAYVLTLAALIVLT